MKASDYIAATLHNYGVRCAFEVSGGMITHLLDSINRQGKLRLVSVHHEQAAAFAADAVGRITGVPGVALATSGPGATNLLTGVASCYFDSSPAVFLTGQVNRDEQKGERNIRQLGFQETDIVSMVAPITKAAWKVKQARAFRCCLIVLSPWRRKADRDRFCSIFLWTCRGWKSRRTPRYPPTRGGMRGCRRIRLRCAIRLTVFWLPVGHWY